MCIFNKNFNSILRNNEKYIDGKMLIIMMSRYILLGCLDFILFNLINIGIFVIIFID